MAGLWDQEQSVLHPPSLRNPLIHRLLIAAAKATEGLDSDPVPFVLQTSLDDFYVSYELNAYTAAAAEMPQLYSRLHQHIQDQFNKAGVEIMSPHYSALRDGNTTAVPPVNLPKGYKAPGFRVQRFEETRGRPGLKG